MAPEKEKRLSAEKPHPKKKSPHLLSRRAIVVHVDLHKAHHLAVLFGQREKVRPDGLARAAPRGREVGQRLLVLAEHGGERLAALVQVVVVQGRGGRGEARGEAGTRERRDGGEGSSQQHGAGVSCLPYLPALWRS